MKIASTAHRAGAILDAMPPPEGEDTRLVEISVSSEEPYLREDADEPFWEVLGHGGDEVDMTRLNSGAAPLLTDHIPSVSTQAGVVLRAWIEGGKVRAVVRFATTAAAADLLAKVRDGIVTCVSVGYRIIRPERTGESRDGLPVVRVTRWQPYEVSFVSIPADPTVGLGRADANTPDIDVSNPLEERQAMPDANPTPANPTPAPPSVDLDAIRATAAREAMTRSAEIDAFARKFDLPADLVDTAKRENVSLDDFRQRTLDHIETRNAAPVAAGATRIGMQDENVRDWSLFRAVRYLMNPHSTSAQKDAGFEIECSRAFSEKAGREAGGLFIPDEVLADPNFTRSHGQRSQNTLTAAAGGALVPTQHMSGQFIDVLRARMVTSRLGARVISGLSGTIDIPKRTAGASLYWLTEDEDVTDSASSFGTVAMSAKGAGMAVPITRRMLQNGSPDVEALVRDDLLTGIAIGTDKVALVGDASAAAPSGLRDLILSNALEWAGTDPTFAEMVALETAVAVANADLGNLSYAYGPQVSGHLKTTPKFSGGEIPVEMDGRVNGYSAEKTTSMAAGEVMFGNWGDLLIGYWSGFDLRVDTATKAASDGRVLRVFVDMDVNARHLESFKLGKRS